MHEYVSTRANINATCLQVIYKMVMHSPSHVGDQDINMKPGKDFFKIMDASHDQLKKITRMNFQKYIQANVSVIPNLELEVA